MEVIRFPWMTSDFLMDVVSTNPHMQSACDGGPALQELHTLTPAGDVVEEDKPQLVQALQQHNPGELLGKLQDIPGEAS
ncbi:unnamed protein product [Sphagnum balticum]